MNRTKRERIAQRTVSGLRDLTRKLRAGIPIEATRLTRIATPDGPMHLREHIVLNTERRDDV